MKVFMLWLISQAIMARVLVGMALEMWSSMHLGTEVIGYFILPTAAICLVEAVTSSIVVFPLVVASTRSIGK